MSAIERGRLRESMEAARPLRSAARQPILTAKERVVGYELLFRMGSYGHFCGIDPDDASRFIIETSSLVGLDVLCNKGLAFINCTRRTLVEGSMALLPAKRAVIEILETVPPDDEVRAACLRLKAAGHKIALDDFVLDDPRTALADLADFIKVDLQLMSMADAAEIVRRHGSSQCVMVAEKVETREEFEQAEAAGFELFQGYFFRKPRRVRTRSLQANRAVSMRLLQAVSRPELDWDEMESVLRSDPVLCVRLLRHVNSAVLALDGTIHSLRQAMNLLGEYELRRWCRLSLLLEMTHDRPSDLMLSAMTRACFCELLAGKVDRGGADAFLLGLMSLMDAILEVPMAQVVKLLSLAEEMRAVLLRRKGRLAELLELVIAFEAAQWGTAAQLAKRLKLADDLVTDAHWEAMAWSQSLASAAEVAA